MKKVLIGIIIGLFIGGGVSYAYRIPRPMRITDFDQKNLVILNEMLENLWDVTNGRYSINILTVNPDSVTKGDVGDMVLLSSGGNWYFEVNVDGAKTWRGIQLQNTP